ncbi:hypothetical protein, variant [Sphaeroforma arctica JP610]|nr:hypothetical protein, variant [Sphaeroforma arctica JP610]KNC85589.1 hypothetical protein, variant [Sphaeroforma arctica JP610]|eukprot:XP_014159491.1 hypothetical protein, variant [Sphaeroforma arctica JP610]
MLAAPLPHIGVTSYRLAKTDHGKALVIGVGILGTTALSLGMRGYLMYHAGYAGGSGMNNLSEDQVRKRMATVSTEEGSQIENPSANAVLKEALKGFG